MSSCGPVVVDADAYNRAMRPPAAPDPSDQDDPYAALGVARDADAAVILAAYREEARRHHPDVSTDPASQHRMAELNAAWSVLRDPARRSAWDEVHRVEEPGAGVVSRPQVSTNRAETTRGACVWVRGPGGQGAAGPPPGWPSGSVIPFGRYMCWSVGEIARVDLGYLQWLADRPEGQQFRPEIEAVLAPHLGHARPAADPRSARRSA